MTDKIIKFKFESSTLEILVNPEAKYDMIQGNFLE